MDSSVQAARLVAASEAAAVKLDGTRSRVAANIGLATSRLSWLRELEGRAKAEIMRVEGLVPVMKSKQVELALLARQRDVAIEAARSTGGADGAAAAAALARTDFTELSTAPVRTAASLRMPAVSVADLEARQPDILRRSTPAPLDSTAASAEALGQRSLKVARSSGPGSFPSFTSPVKEGPADGPDAAGPAAGAAGGAGAVGGASAAEPATPTASSAGGKTRRLSRTLSGRMLQELKGVDMAAAREEAASLERGLAAAGREDEELKAFLMTLQAAEAELNRCLAAATAAEEELAPTFDRLAAALEVAQGELQAAQAQVQAASKTQATADSAEWDAALQRAEAEKQAAATPAAAAAGEADAAVSALSPATVVAGEPAAEVAGSVAAAAAAGAPSGEPLRAVEVPVDASDIPASPPVESATEAGSIGGAPGDASPATVVAEQPAADVLGKPQEAAGEPAPSGSPLQAVELPVDASNIPASPPVEQAAEAQAATGAAGVIAAAATAGAVASRAAAPPLPHGGPAAGDASPTTVIAGEPARDVAAADRAAGAGGATPAGAAAGAGPSEQEAASLAGTLPTSAVEVPLDVSTLPASPPMEAAVERGEVAAIEAPSAGPASVVPAPAGAAVPAALVPAPAAAATGAAIVATAVAAAPPVSGPDGSATASGAGAGTEVAQPAEPKPSERRLSARIAAPLFVDTTPQPLQYYREEQKGPEEVHQGACAKALDSCCSVQ